MIDFEWLGYFKEAGYPEARRLASGMDGTVFLLIKDQSIAKVWHRRDLHSIEKLRAFYSSLQPLLKTLQIPFISDVRVVNRHVITIEKFIAGKTLDDARKTSSFSDAYEPITACLKTLSSVQTVSELNDLPLLGETILAPWSQKISNLIVKRLNVSREHLAKSVDAFRHLEIEIHEFLKWRASSPTCLIHGDLFGGNVMVDKTYRAVGILDFGHLTTIGDPAFDAAVTSGICDMYGPAAKSTSDNLISYFVSELGHSRKTMLAYRAVYACLTSNEYSRSGSDGHFAWCVSQLNDIEVRSALRAGD